MAPGIAHKSVSRRDYTGRYVGSTTPATWQEKTDSLQAGLAAARRDGSAYRVTICERALAQHQAIDPDAYDRRFVLLAAKGGAR